MRCSEICCAGLIHISWPRPSLLAGSASRLCGLRRRTALGRAHGWGSRQRLRRDRGSRNATPHNHNPSKVENPISAEGTFAKLQMVTTWTCSYQPQACREPRESVSSWVTAGTAPAKESDSSDSSSAGPCFLDGDRELQSLGRQVEQD